MKFKPLKWESYWDITLKHQLYKVRCGEAQIAFIVWRHYKGARKIKGHYSVFLYFGDEGECEHAIPSDNIKHAKLFVKNKWKEFKKEIVL